MQRLFFLTAAMVTMAAAPAFAHTGGGATSGLLYGFMHPIGGLDHLLAMVAVGVLASQLGGKSIWMVPLAFVGMMVVGGILGVYGAALPLVEIGIVGSVVVLGVVIAVGRQIPMVAAMALVGALAIFHGHAHGTEMPVTTSGFQYGIGFVVATGMLHAIGVGLGVGVQRFVEKMAPTAIRAGGGAIAASGALLFIA